MRKGGDSNLGFCPLDVIGPLDVEHLVDLQQLLVDKLELALQVGQLLLAGRVQRTVLQQLSISACKRKPFLMAKLKH